MADEPGGASIVMNITSSTVVKASPGRIALIATVQTAASPSSGSVHNCTTVGAATDANKVHSIPAFANAPPPALINSQVPCDAGIVVIPGANTRVYVTYT